MQPTIHVMMWLQHKKYLFGILDLSMAVGAIQATKEFNLLFAIRSEFPIAQSTANVA